MAYQPKSYRKFVATAATATLVAGAVAPLASAATFTDVSAKYKEAVDFVVSKGAKGLTETQFGVQENIKRVDAAVLLAQVLELDIEKAPASGFTDVPERAAKYVNALKAAGITTGKTATTFGSQDLITRGELAIMIQKGFDLKGEADSKFTDVSDRYKEAVSALVANGITNGVSETQFGTEQNAKRGDYAIFLYKADQVKHKVVATVDKATAIDTNTVVLTGTHLNQLKAEDITLAGNKVVSVTPSTDGTSATVVFESKFASGTEQTLKVNLNGETKEVKFTFDFSISSINLHEGTYDDNKDGQQLTFSVNGSPVPADTEYLRQAGYKVTFVATDEFGGPANIFDGDKHTCNTGLLSKTNKIGDYTVEVQIEKDGKIVASSQKTISIIDVETATTAINSLELRNTSGFIQHSSTLVIGEALDVKDVIGNAGGKTNVSLPKELVEVSSSNDAVISVSNKNGDINFRANTKGTATITVKIGKVTKTFDFTVTNVEREVTTVAPSEDSFDLVKGKERKIQVTTMDQYGDPIDIFAYAAKKGHHFSDYVEIDVPQTANHKDIVSVLPFSTDQDGKTHCGVTIIGLTAGEGTIYFKDKAGNKLGSVEVGVTEKDNHVKTIVEKTVGSLGKSDTFDVGSSRSYQITHLNEDGAYNGNVFLNEKADAHNQAAYTVQAVDPKVADITLSHDKQSFTVKGLKAGSTDIKVLDYAGNLKHSFTVTITDEKVVTTAVKFKDTSETITSNGKKVTVADVLDVRASEGKDAIVYGLDHNVNTIAPVRLTWTNKDFGPLWKPNNDKDRVYNPLKAYIDENNNGKFDVEYDRHGNVVKSEEVIAYVKAEVLTGSSTDKPGETITPGFGKDPGIKDIRVDGDGVYTTAYGEKGTILFRVITDANGDGHFTDLETLASTTLKIDVPNK